MDNKPPVPFNKIELHPGTIGGNPSNFNFWVDVPSFVVDPKITSFAQEQGFAPKDKFHLSVISFANQKKLMGLNDPDLYAKVEKLSSQYTWSYSLDPEYFVIQKYYDQVELEKSGYKDTPEHWRKTIVQKAMLPDMVDFYKKLSDLTGIKFDTPFSHLTLFSWSNYEPLMKQGIGLTSESDFEKYKQQQILV